MRRTRYDTKGKQLYYNDIVILDRLWTMAEPNSKRFHFHHLTQFGPFPSLTLQFHSSGPCEQSPIIEFVQVATNSFGRSRWSIFIYQFTDWVLTSGSQRFLWHFTINHCRFCFNLHLSEFICVRARCNSTLFRAVSEVEMIRRKKKKRRSDKVL